MTLVDFAAAQQRVSARQAAQAAYRQANLEQQLQSPASRTIAKLPFPFRNVGQSGLLAWNNVRGRGGTRPAFRVGQVDAELLDEELLELLRSQVGEGLKYFGTHIRDDWSSEIQVALRAILFKLSIWDHDASYGAALQNLRYTDARVNGPILQPPSKWQKCVYGLVSVTGRYAWDKWENRLIDREGETPRHIQLLTRFSSLASTTHSILAFASFLVFLVNGRYRTLLDRVLRMRLATPSHQLRREISFEYLNRQLVWHAFTEFLLFLLPLVGINRWKRWLSRAWRKAKAAALSTDEDESEEKKGELSFLPERTCAICFKEQNPTSMAENEVMAVAGASGGVVGSAQTDITNPYETIPCGCLYCYVCIATRLEAEEGDGWICLRCGELVKECKPWNGDVAEEVLSEDSDPQLEPDRFKDVLEPNNGDEKKAMDNLLIGEETSHGLEQAEVG